MYLNQKEEMKVLLLETGFIILSKYRDFVTTVNTGNWKPEYFFSHIYHYSSFFVVIR